MPRKIAKLTNEEFLAEKSALMTALREGQLTLGQATKKMRTMLGMTQDEYASKIVGVHSRTLLEIENDNGNPRLETLNKIAKPFGLFVSFSPKSA